MCVQYILTDPHLNTVWGAKKSLLLRKDGNIVLRVIFCSHTHLTVAGYCQSLHGMHVLNRDVVMIATNKRNTWHGLCWTNQQHFSVEVEFFSENLLNRGDSHFSHKFLFPFIVMENGHFNWEYQVFERCGNGVIGWEWSNAPVMIPFWRFGEEIELVLRICEIKGTKPSTTGFGWGLAKESEIQC